MKQDYYKTIAEEIESLIETNPKEAIQKLEVELNMPYVPKKYEMVFLDLLEKIRTKLKQDAVVNNELSKEEVIEIITTNDAVKMPMAIAKLKDLNLRAMLEEIQKVISNQEVSNVIKTIIYEYCIEQSIDHNFDWNGIIINPKIVGSTISLKAYQEAYIYIESVIIKNPSLQNVAKSFLELYALNTFPNFIDEKDGLGECIVSIAFDSMGLPQIKKGDVNRINTIKQFLNA